MVYCCIIFLQILTHILQEYSTAYSSQHHSVPESLSYYPNWIFHSQILKSVFELQENKKKNEWKNINTHTFRYVNKPYIIKSLAPGLFLYYPIPSLRISLEGSSPTAPPYRLCDFNVDLFNKLTVLSRFAYKK